MKKYLFSIITAIMTMICVCACDSGKSGNPAQKDKLSIVTTIFPEYDWVMNVLGERSADVEVTMLLDNGVDLHSYQPTADDIFRISNCDMFIYVGGESDEWVEDALKEVTNKDMAVINLLDVLGDAVKEEEVVEGMQEEEHDHDHGDHDEEGHDDGDHDEEGHDDGDHDEEAHVDGDHDEEGHDDGDHDEDDHEGGHGHEHEEGEIEYDEHVWLSLRNARVLVQSISDALGKIDPDNAAVYKKNSSAYVGKLEALDESYKTAVNDAVFHTLLFGDRFPFRYLVDDYGLDYYAAFVGCSAETEASFETVTFLAKKVDELGLKCVMTIEGTDHRIAETIVENTQTKDQKILSLDSMQSTTSGDVKNGAAYLTIMESNLVILESALSQD